MNCDMAHDLLQQSLDGVLIESPEWLAHLRACADCRSLAAAGRRLQDGLHRLPTPQPPVDLAARIIGAVRLDRKQARRLARRRWTVAVALAASLLIALTLLFPGAKPPPRESGVSPVGIAEERREHDVTRESPTLRESAAELGEVFASLSNQTADETVGQTRRWVSNVPSPSLPKVELMVMGSPARPLREAGEGVSEGLEPVAVSARRAVDLFLRDLPMERETN